MKKLILVIGAPGSGKTTDSSLVAKHHSDKMTSYSLGDVMRDEIKKGSALGKISNDYISKGELVPTAVVIDILYNTIINAPTDIVLVDGFPREDDQMKTFGDVLFNKKDTIELVSVIELQVDEETAMKRVLGENDDIEKRRLFNKAMKIYKNAIREIEDFYKDKNLLKVIDASRDIKEVVADIDKFLEDKIAELHK